VSEVHVIVPEGIRDPARPSGGNTYDREACRELAALGWTVREHAVAGDWPAAGERGEAALARAMAAVSDGACVLIDGLIASASPGVLVPQADRLRLVVLVHMPLGHAAERDVLAAAAGVVTTSAWTRGRLIALYGLPSAHVHVARPGVRAAPLAPGTAGGGRLLCVAAVTPAKGHDVLVDALAAAADLPWRCTCAGSIGRDPTFARAVRAGAVELGLGTRLHFTGPLVGAELDAAYATADVLVLPSRAETYGMVLTEALARGLPVITAAVGGVPEALGDERAGLLVPPGDSAALAAALRRWLTDAGLRERLRGAAAERRGSLRPWSATAADVARALAAARAAEPMEVTA
jgi:glycosyltransferase involved in cell wall biosynthesis